MLEQPDLRLVSEAEYLKTEETSPVKHEFVNGCLFAMTGATEAHNIISRNLVLKLGAHLEDGPCGLFFNDMKVKVESAYYYPDIFVSCETFEAASVYKEAPTLIIEILSKSTASIGKREKLTAYIKIGSLQEYVVVHQHQQKVELLRRVAGAKWKSLTFTSGDTLELESMPNGILKIPLSTIYKGHNPPTRVKEPEEHYEFDPVY